MDSATRVATRWAASKAGSSAEDHLKVLRKLITRRIKDWEFTQRLPVADPGFCQALADVIAELKRVLKSGQGGSESTTYPAINRLPVTPKSPITYWHHLDYLAGELTFIFIGKPRSGLSYQKELTEILGQLDKLQDLLGC